MLEQIKNSLNGLTPNQNKGVKVAEESTNGHFIKGCEVKCLDKSTGFYAVKSNDPSGVVTLMTENHGTITEVSTNGVAILTQVEYNNLNKVFQRSRD